jgi:hypothetical protein
VERIVIMACDGRAVVQKSLEFPVMLSKHWGACVTSIVMGQAHEYREKQGWSG